MSVDVDAWQSLQAEGWSIAAEDTAKAETEEKEVNSEEGVMKKGSVLQDSERWNSQWQVDSAVHESNPRQWEAESCML